MKLPETGFFIFPLLRGHFDKEKKNVASTGIKIINFYPQKNAVDNYE